MPGDRPGPRPLAGLRVLDFTHAAAGPFTTMLLGDLGADIVKIEKPNSGDGSRSMGSPMPDFPKRNSDYYLSLNRNKRSIALDLAQPAGVAIATRLAGLSDIVVQNFRPGVLDRLGLGYDDLRGLRPSLVYCSISAFGPDGPWSERPANDIIMQSVSGLMGITGEVGGGPVRIGAPISDFSTGLFALSGILAALFKRDAFPDGQHVEIAMLEASLNMMCNYIPSVAGLGTHVPRLGRSHAQIVPYQAFLCGDGEYLMVGAFTRNFWVNLCGALERTEWTSDPRFSTNSARLRHRDLLVGEFEAIFATQTRSHWLALLEAADVPCSPVLELHDAVRSEQVNHAGSIETITGRYRDVQVVRSPIRVDAWESETPVMSPDLGENSREILAGLLGLGDDEIDRMIAAGTISTADATA